MLKKTLVKSFTLIHKDKRRALREFESKEGKFSIQHYEVFKKVPMGNEFHKKREEIFVIVEGGGTVLLRRIGENGTPISKLQKHIIKAPATIWIPPYTAHTLVMRPGTKMICYTNRLFEPKDRYSITLQ